MRAPLGVRPMPTGPAIRTALLAATAESRRQSDGAVIDNYNSRRRAPLTQRARHSTQWAHLERHANHLIHI